MEASPLVLRLNNGRTLPVNTCSCGHCANDWFMTGLSDEWMPNFCPYCGIEFLRREVDGKPDVFRPSDGSTT